MDLLKRIFIGIFGSVAALVGTLFASLVAAWILMLFAGGWASEWFGIDGVAYWQALVTLLILRTFVLEYRSDD